MSVKDPSDDWLKDYFEEDGIYKYPEHGEDFTEVLKRVLSRLEKLEGVIIGDEILRSQHPQLQDAWEKYLVVRNLVRKE